MTAAGKTVLPKTVRPDERLAVIDSYALYHISVGHSAEAAQIGERALSGALELMTPAAAFAVASGMRDCWDDECRQAHAGDPAQALRHFYERAGVTIVNPTPDLLLSAGGLYARCGDAHVGGAEVLAACHAALLAREDGLPLLSTGRARYCYNAIGAAAPARLHLIG